MRSSKSPHLKGHSSLYPGETCKKWHDSRCDFNQLWTWLILWLGACSQFAAPVPPCPGPARSSWTLHVGAIEAQGRQVGQKLLATNSPSTPHTAPHSTGTVLGGNCTPQEYREDHHRFHPVLRPFTRSAHHMPKYTEKLNLHRLHLFLRLLASVKHITGFNFRTFYMQLESSVFSCSKKSTHWNPHTYFNVLILLR